MDPSTFKVLKDWNIRLKKDKKMKKLVLLSIIASMVCGAGEFEAEVLIEQVEAADSTGLTEIIEQGKSNSEEMDAYSLVILSMASLKNDDFLNAELFLYQAQLRAVVDKEVYPPIKTGGNSPLLALMALRQQILFALSEVEQKTVEDYQILINSIENWQPSCKIQYSPGWDHGVTPDLKLCQSRFDELIEKNVKAMKKNEVLYSHPEYFTLLKQWRDLSMAILFNESGKQDEKLINLQNKLLGIEKEFGIKGEVTQNHLMVNLDSSKSNLVGSWKFFKDDDTPGKEVENEVIYFRGDGEFCVEATNTFGGEYELKPKTLTLFVSLFGEITPQKREYELQDKVLKLKNKKVGWAYYKKTNDKPKESCFTNLVN